MIGEGQALDVSKKPHLLKWTFQLQMHVRQSVKFEKHFRQSAVYLVVSNV
jgi:hypothetical protein